MNTYLENNSLLAQRLKIGDLKAYNFLMDTYYRKLCAYAFTLSKDYAKAEDIVQNVFVEVWTKRKNMNTDLSIKSYLYKSVYNGFIDQYRKNKPVIYLEKKYLEAIDQVVDEEHDNFEELLRLVHIEIDRLPSKCKRIFLLNKQDGLTHVEISEHLDISIKTVEGHMTRAFKILGEKLEEKVRPILFLLFDFRNQFNH